MNRFDPMGTNWWEDLKNGFKNTVSNIVDGITEFVSNFVSDYNALPTQTDQGNSTASGHYDYGDIYIVKTQEEIKDLSVRPMDVVVVDNRSGNDPSIQIRNSYKIINTADQSAILDVIVQYDQNNPVNPSWSRTKESMLEEWRLHNLAYMIFFFNADKRERAKHVDLNNNDEGMIFWDFATTR